LLRNIFKPETEASEKKKKFLGSLRWPESLAKEKDKKVCCRCQRWMQVRHLQLIRAANTAIAHSIGVVAASFIEAIATWHLSSGGNSS
jgi:hypothetical protein